MSQPVTGTRLPAWLPIVFGASGFAALLYQIVWQRMLFTAFGVNVEAVTIVVAAFLAGLGAGSLVGGWIGRCWSGRLLTSFGFIELSIGLFGLCSPFVFDRLGQATLRWPDWSRAVVLALTVTAASSLMGASLPVLVEEVSRATRNVGRAVGSLYFVNTAGSALAAFAAVMILLGWAGETRTVFIAAALNLACGGFVLLGPARLASR